MTNKTFYAIINTEQRERKIVMTGFILGIFLMWFILAELICIGDEYFEQKCDWEDWWIWIICFPAVIFQFPISLISFVIKAIKKYCNKKPKSK